MAYTSRRKQTTEQRIGSAGQRLEYLRGRLDIVEGIEDLPQGYKGESYGGCHQPQLGHADQKDPATAPIKSRAPVSDPSACRPLSSTPLTHAGPWPGTPRAKPSSSPSGTTKRPTPRR